MMARFTPRNALVAALLTLLALLPVYTGATGNTFITVSSQSGSLMPKPSLFSMQSSL